MQPFETKTELSTRWVLGYTLSYTFALIVLGLSAWEAGLAYYALLGALAIGFAAMAFLRAAPEIGRLKRFSLAAFFVFATAMACLAKGAYDQKEMCAQMGEDASCTYVERGRMCSVGIFGVLRCTGPLP